MPCTDVSDAALARWSAYEAGRLLMTLRDPARGPADLRRLGDAQSHDLLMAALAQHRPGDSVLSEEGVDDPMRLRADRVWIIDPLDGTREFGEPSRTDWAVHVALWQRGELTAAAVALPARGVTYATDRPTQHLDVASRTRADEGTPIRLAVSRSRPPEFVVRLAEALGAELVPMGSAGVKAVAVLTGEADAYVHAGGQYEWDSAAPVGVCRAAGLHTSRIDGSPLQYNQADPLLPDLLICRPGVRDSVLTALRALGQETGAPR